MNYKKLSTGLAMVFSCAVFFTACYSGSTNSPTTPIVSRGVISKGGVIVNGVTYDVSGAPITFNGKPGDASQLQDGVTVKIRGKLNSDGATGLAEKVEIQSETGGPVTGKGTDSITVFGQQIFIDDRTVFANSNFQVGWYAEVYGIRDSQERFLATRVEAQNFQKCGIGSDNIEKCIPIPFTDDHLTGFAEAPINPGKPPFLSFNLRGYSVNTGPDTLITPAGAGINIGDLVRISEISELSIVTGTNITPGLIERVDLADAEFEPQENEQFEVEGFVAGFTTLNADFTVSDITTRLSGTTGFENGTSADMTNNVRIEAEGRMAGGVLIADKIKFVN
jgi:uncharacterized protein DUF5666